MGAGFPLKSGVCFILGCGSLAAAPPFVGFKTLVFSKVLSSFFGIGCRHGNCIVEGRRTLNDETYSILARLNPWPYIDIPECRGSGDRDHEDKDQDFYSC